MSFINTNWMLVCVSGTIGCISIASILQKIPIFRNIMNWNKQFILKNKLRILSMMSFCVSGLLVQDSVVRQYFHQKYMMGFLEMSGAVMTTAITVDILTETNRRKLLSGVVATLSVLFGYTCWAVGGSLPVLEMMKHAFPWNDSSGQALFLMKFLMKTSMQLAGLVFLQGFGNVIEVPILEIFFKKIISATQ